MRRKSDFLDEFEMKRIESLAQATLDEVGVATTPIDLKTICRFYDIEVRAKPVTSTGVSGMLVRSGNNFGIICAQHIDSIGFRRFCIAHEIGHYKIPGHPEAVFDSRGIHESHAGFISDQQFEREADYFAANLLMPRKLLLPEIEVAQNGLAIIKSLADKFQTSLTSMAIRYIELTDDIAAVVVSSRNKIEWCSMSSAFREITGLDWLRRNEPVSRNTVTAEALADKTKAEMDGSSNLQDWFNGPHDIEVVEEVMRLGTSDKVLTMIHDIDIPEEEETDEYYEDRWTPRFK